MAHELMYNDNGKVSIMYVDEVPWHGLGQKLIAAPTAAEAIKAAGLDWKVAKTPLFYHESIEVTGIVPGYYAVVPTEGWQNCKRPVLGVVTDRYNPVQNKEAFSFFDPFVEKGKATYETAGALGEGERVWVMAKLKNTMRIGRKGSDEVNKYLLLSNSHDGKSAVQIKFTPIRVVCNNTLSMALEDGRAIKIEHTQDVDKQLKRVQDLFDNIIREYADIEKVFQRMASFDITDDLMNKYFGDVFPDPAPPGKGSEEHYEAEKKRVLRDKECCKYLLEQPRNQLPETRNTVWSIYNAVTEYVDHRQSSSNLRSSNPSMRLRSIWFGKGSSIKIHAFNTAIKMVSTK
ncbi:MAG: DUF932 domain-containing protein [Kiritimatiellia bacterium]